MRTGCGVSGSGCWDDCFRQHPHHSHRGGVADRSGPRMRGVITGLFGFATVMFVAAWVGLMQGKGLILPCVLFGIIAGGIGCLLWRKELRDKAKQ